MLAGGVELDVGGAGPVHFGGNDFMGQFGTVAVAAEVAEINVAEVGVDDGFEGGGGGFVGEVAVAAGDALLQRPGAAGIVLEHF